MFERYTERARRVLFFARYEASELGSLSINTEHLLLGLIREGKGLTTRRIFARANISLESLRAEIVGRTVFQEKVATSLEIPFSADTKRVLQFAAQEADQLSHNYIGTEHLLLGILHEKQSLAGSILVEKGLQLDAVRSAIVVLTETPVDGTFSRDDQSSLVDVYVLTALGGPPLRSPLEDAAGTISWRTSPDGTITDIAASGATVGILCSVLEETLGVPFVDETTLTDRYDFEVHNGGSTVAAFLQALHEQLGLVATLERRDSRTLSRRWR
jgi:hypothetical protein